MSAFDVTVQIVGTVKAIESMRNDPRPINILSQSGQVLAGTLSLLNAPGFMILGASQAIVFTTGKILTDARSGNIKGTSNN